MKFIKAQHNNGREYLVADMGDLECRVYLIGKPPKSLNARLNPKPRYACSIHKKGSKFSLMRALGRVHEAYEAQFHCHATALREKLITEQEELELYEGEF